MTLSNCESLDNLFHDLPEEEENSKFIEGVRMLMSRNDMGYPSAITNGTYCLRKVKSLNSKQWKINKKQKYTPSAGKKKSFDFHEQRSLILNLNLWKFIKFINCNGKNNYNKNNKHATHLNKTLNNDNVLPLQKSKSLDNDQRLENLFWRSWFKAHKKKDVVSRQRERHIKFNDNVEQCIITDDHFIQRLPPAQLNLADDQSPCPQFELNSSPGYTMSKRVFYDYSCVYFTNDATASTATTTAAVTAMITSSTGDHQHRHDIRDVPKNVLPRDGEADLGSVLRVDSNFKLSNIGHHSPATSSSTSSHSTFIFESETDSDTDTDSDTTMPSELL
ncbi:Reg2p [Saccharomyces cerevisiae x Saccharomyces kudriavzevii VIN7]|uniref:Reg2p n=1 Tax=Saccharomyces cerevisiae x Saccharomyces kudriavzevii (strain VIN7) TaxID=1095631 RepID=H0GR74_SACCK|nr:Reg2p [Saccharomyces cerevisiae x Saccharomyces kudriavzevii VIN7]